jgi:hypothetical protein
MLQELIELPARPQPRGWWHWPNVQEAYRHAAAAFARDLPTYPGGFVGRGIVIAGGGAYFPSAYITLRTLRHVGCALPVQLWHLAGELTPRMIALIEPLGAVCVNADAVARSSPFRFLHGHWWKGWQLKPYAVAHCSFEEVLLLDADCYPVRDPGFLFEWRQYQERGAVFWPDLTSSSGLLAMAARTVFGVEPGRPAFESGQVLIDKRRSWPELQLTLWYNAHADFVYHHLWGDKDTFNLAWNQLGRAYAMPHKHATWDTHTIVQYDGDGAPLFQHRCRDKFRLDGEAFPGSPQQFAENHFNPRLAHEEFCFQARDELRRLWRR